MTEYPGSISPGPGVEAYYKKEYNKAKQHFLRSAESGNAGAWVWLGIMHEKGLGVNRDYKKAVEYYQLASDKGDGLGKYYLALIYYRGTEIPTNYTEAFKLFSYLAEQKDINGSYYLGHMYANGRGVSKDAREALKLYSYAAEMGNVDAQYGSALLYDSEDTDFPADKIKAFMWYDIAVKNGKLGAAKNRKIIASKMTAKEINIAKTNANKWQKLHMQAEDI